MDAAQFEQNVKNGGVPFAIKTRWPGLEANDKGTMDELRKLVALRQRYIGHLTQIYGFTFSEAEMLADGKGSTEAMRAKMDAAHKAL